MNGSVHIRWSSSWPFRRNGWFSEEAPEANQNEGSPTQGRSPASDHEVSKIVTNMRCHEMKKYKRNKNT